MLHKPVFILGAPRSGTTVFRLMLDAHEEITNPGESDFIFDHIRKNPATGDWACDFYGLRHDRVFQDQNLRILSSDDGRQIALDFVDQLQKRASNYLCLVVHRNADKLAELFADCKIIHLFRDPRDVANSCIRMGWAGNTYFGIDFWRDTESKWNSAKKLFSRDNILELKYEELIARPQEQLQRVCSFIGIPFSPTMLRYPERSTYAPPDRRAIERWRRKHDPRSIALVEVKTRTLLLERGYTLSGYPLNPPGLFEKAKLEWGNKASIWKIRSSFYGSFNSIMEILTRKLVRPLHPAFVKRMNEIQRLHLIAPVCTPPPDRGYDHNREIDRKCAKPEVGANQ